MHKLWILFCTLLVLTMLSSAQAAPKRADGGKCDTVGSERKDGKDQNGNTINCKWDTCTYTQCSTSGNTISNCVKKTEYSNPTDCKAAAGRNSTKVPALRAPTINQLKQ